MWLCLLQATLVPAPKGHHSPPAHTPIARLLCSPRILVPVASSSLSVIESMMVMNRRMRCAPSASCPGSMTALLNPGIMDMTCGDWVGGIVWVRVRVDSGPGCWPHGHVAGL